MLKRIFPAVAMTALLSTASTHAHLPSKSATEELYDRGTQLGAAFHRTVSNPVSQESRWWEAFEKSGKNILIYVEDLATKDSEAAMWFLVTGGKHGFSSRQATQEEEQLILSAMQKVAKSFASSENKKEAYEKWVGMEKAHQAGHLHLKMIYQQIDDLKKANESLNLRLSALEVKNSGLEGEIKGLKVLNSSLEERLSKTEAKNQSLEEKLEEERLERIKDIQALSNQRIQDAKDHQMAIDRAVAAAEEKSAKQFRDFLTEFKQQAEDSKKEQLRVIEILLAKADGNAKSMIEEVNNKFLTIVSESQAKAQEREHNFWSLMEKEKKEAQQREEANNREAKKREEELLARIAKIEQEAREREQAILSVIGKDVERLPNIERLADKSVELGFQTRDLSQETLRSTNPTAFNQFLKKQH